jgi:hypothetical protein
MRGRSRCLLRAANAAHVARVLSRRRSLAMLRAPPPGCISVSFVCFAPRPRRPRLPRRRRRRLHRQLLEALWRCYHVRRDDVTDLPRADARAEHVLTATWLQAANQLSRRGVFVHVHGKSFCRNDFPSEATREVNKLSEHFALLLPHAHMHLGLPLSASAPRLTLADRLTFTHGRRFSRLGARHRDKRNIVIRRALGIATPRPNAPRVFRNARPLVLHRNLHRSRAPPPPLPPPPPPPTPQPSARVLPHV